MNEVLVDTFKRVNKMFENKAAYENLSRLPGE